MSIKKIKSWIRSTIIPYKPLKVDKDKWDEQYIKGHWDYLKSFEQLGRFSIISGKFYFYYSGGGSVLDLGCGEGVLQKMIKPYKYSNYVGVDVSENAINIASEESDEKTSFICSDISTFEPDSTFDMIVFNESLYYLDEPNKVLHRYRRYLNKEGLIIISMWDYKERNNKIWKLIQSDFKPNHETIITADNKITWIIKSLRPTKD